MPTGIPAPTTAAFSPAAIRNRLRERVAVPQEMLNDALRKIHANLEAKETKHFSFQGSVVDTRQVDALSIQQQAAELIVRMAELVSVGQPKAAEQRVEVVIDAKTGTMRIVIGDESPAIAPQEANQLAPAALPQEEGCIGPVINASQPEQEEVDNVDTDDTEHIKVPKGTLPTAVRAALGFTEPTVGSG